MNTHDKDKTSGLSAGAWAVICTAFVVGCLLLTALIYGYLIWSNCNSQGLGDFFSDVRAFHTYEGC